MNWLAHTKTTLLNPQEIDLSDTRYWIPCFASIEPLRQSISKLGIISPPVAQERESGILIPILGRRRLAAAMSLGVQQATVIVVSREMPEAEAFSLAFWDNVAHRSLDAAATAVVTRRLLHYFPRDVAARDFLPTLGVPAQGPRIERLSAVGGLELPLLEALAAGRIQEKTAWLLTKLEEPERLKLFDVTERLGLNANKRAELIVNLFDLAAFHGKPVSMFLEEPTAQAILSDSATGLPERAARFRALVRSWKYPELSAQESEFHRQFGALSLPDRVAVRPAVSFETPECTVEIRCETPEEALQALRYFGARIRKSLTPSEAHNQSSGKP